MPFNKEALFELLERTELNQSELARELKEFTKREPLAKFIGQPYISKLLAGNSKCSLDYLDTLCLFARYKGFEDLEFYITPPDKNPPMYYI